MRVLLLLLLLLAPAWARPGDFWVELDGREILSISEAPGQPGAVRVAQMQSALVKLLENPNAAPLEVREDGEHFQVVSGNLVVGEVLDSDAATQGLGRRQVAELWSWLLQEYLQAARQERAGKHYPRAIGNTVLYLLFAMLCHVLLGKVLYRWGVHPLPLRVVLWLTTFALIGTEFPTTRTVASQVLLHLVLPLLSLSLIIAGTTLLSRFLSRSLTVYFNDLEKFWRTRPDLHPRPQRAQMLRQGVSVVAQSALVLSAFVLAMRTVGVDVGAAVAGAGVVGVGLSLVARDLLADWFAGVQIVAEDQFGVGDTITVGTQTGVVEHFSLRATRLRLEDGSLMSLSNSQVRTVVNHATRHLVLVSWSVPRDADLNEALARVEQVARQLVEERPEMVTGEPRLDGVAGVEANTLLVRVALPVQSDQDAAVRAELLRRLSEAFRESQKSSQSTSESIQAS